MHPITNPFDIHQETPRCAALQEGLLQSISQFRRWKPLLSCSLPLPHPQEPVSSPLQHGSSDPAVLSQLSRAGKPEKNPVEGLWAEGGRLEESPQASVADGVPCYLSALPTELAGSCEDLTLSPLLLPCAAPSSSCLAALTFPFHFGCHLTDPHAGLGASILGFPRTRIGVPPGHLLPCNGVGSVRGRTKSTLSTTLVPEPSAVHLVKSQASDTFLQC